MRAMLIGAAILSPLGAPACAHREFVGYSTTGRDPDLFERAALQRGAVDLQCAATDLMAQSIGASAYRVDGCQRVITYLCLMVPGGWGRTIACTPSQPAAAPIVYAQPVAVAATAPPPPQSITPPPPAGPEVAAARAAIDAHAAGVLACNGGVAVAVDATWDAAGVLTVGVVGHPGTPEEECVRAALVSTVVSPAGSGGHVMHPVEPH